jgi:glycosyltransferase involved in cell wall biosynthesis
MPLGAAHDGPVDIAQSGPRRMLMVGYATVDQAVEKGVVVRGDPLTMELHYNFDRTFEQVAYVVPFGQKTATEQLTDTIVAHELAFDRAALGGTRRLSALFHLPKAVRFLHRIAREFKPDVLLVCGPHLPAVLVKLAPATRKLPSVCFIEAYWETLLDYQTYLPAPVRKLLPRWYNWIYRNFDRYTGAPTLTPDYYTARGMDPRRISRWIQSIDLRLFDRADTRDAPAAVRNAARPIVATVGRLYSEKLPLDALEAFAKAIHSGRPGTLVFVGGGPERANIERRAQALGIAERVIITGALPIAQAFSVMKLADFALAPMQGSALIEAMALGNAIVGYDNETARALVQNGVTGLLVPLRDVDAAADALGELMDDPARARRLGSAARHWVETNYSVGKVRELLADAHVEAWKEKQRGQKIAIGATAA